MSSFRTGTGPKVTHCICHGVSFRELAARARVLRDSGPGDEDTVFESLQRETSCGTGCGTCEPYIRLTIRTGRTEWPVLTT